MKLLLLIAILAMLPGCALTYSTDGQNRSFSAALSPSESDYKAIHQLTD